MKTLKTIITICITLITFTGFSQQKNKNANVDYSKTTVINLKIEVNAKSLKELESSFNITDLETMFNEMETEGDIEFKITCSKPSDYETNSKNEISYKIKASVKDEKAFLEMAERIYNSARKYYID